MARWLLRRILTAALLILILTSAVFFIVRLSPGDPLDQVVAEQFTPHDRELMRQRLGLTGSLTEQYGRWLSAAFRGDFGSSLRQQRPVADIVGEAWFPTLLLTVTAYGLHLILALGTAMWKAGRRGGVLDQSLQILGLVLYSVPGFWLGLILIMVFSLKLGWFPASGLAGPDARFLPWTVRIWDVARHLVLPAATLALGSYMGTARYLTAALDEALSQDYILAARARGLSRNRILWRHALPNALLPLITLIGLQLPVLLGGAVVVETVFGWPGLGRVTIEAIWARDYPVIMATALVSGVAVVLGSLLADLGYRFADPRIRLDKRPEASG